MSKPLSAEERAMLFLASANRHLPYVQGHDWPRLLHRAIKRYLDGPRGR